MKKWIEIGIAILVIVALTTTIIINKMKEKTIYNETYVNGNSAGNLYNAGLFCESNGTVFFSNPDDNNALYSMDLNGSNLKKLCNDQAMYINADNNYVYYVRNNVESGTDYDFFSFNKNSLCRINRDGGKVKILDPDPCIYASLIGNQIYYLHYDDKEATTLYRIGIDGKNKEQVYDYYVFTCSTDGSYFYYNGVIDNGSIYRFQTKSDVTEKFYECNSYKPIVNHNEDIYYLDVDQNNALVHTNPRFDNPITLTNDSIDIYNVYGSYIYYQRYSPKDGNALCRIKNDGSNFEVILEGDFCNINITSHYIYFQDFKTKNILCTETSNPGDISSFSPGIAP